VEIENHIRDSSDREELVITIQKLNAEKTDLKHQVYDLQEHLRAAQKKMGQMEKGAGRLRVREDLTASRGVFSIEDELAAIKKDLISCGIDNYEAVEQQISHVFA
jgi:predicted  nucleic acid-binding Zn-ribbon protein